VKAARLHAYGDVDQFKVEGVPVPTPGTGEVLVKVAASAVNHIDLYIRQGYVAKMIPLELPAVLGVAAAGTIETLGAGVTGFAAGDRVVAHLGFTGKGAHAEYVGRGELAVPIAATFPLEQIGQAHAALAAGPHGKILLQH
jgi:NADPH:quinone reductase-like Zn-dependent oxidoreductase